MVPIVVGVILHVPPEVTSASVIVAPTQTLDGPVIGDGEAFTVTTAVTALVQPALLVTVYVIVADPSATPVIAPDVLPMVAIEKSLLLQVPPAVASVSVEVAPVQMFSEPPMLATVGSGFTVTVAERLQPVERVYVIAEVPDERPDTIPEEDPIDADDPAAVHVPPDVASLRVVVDPTHTLSVPVMATGSGLTVTVAVVKQPVDPRV